MRRNEKAAIVVLVLTFLAACAPGATTVVSDTSACGTPDAAVRFPDPNLAAAVRAALEVGEGDVTCGQVASLRRLTAEEAGITDLRGLEHAVALTRLDLAQNQIVDLTTIGGLPRLGRLGLTSNEIVDLAPLQGLGALTRLELRRI